MHPSKKICANLGPSVVNDFLLAVKSRQKLQSGIFQKSKKKQASRPAFKLNQHFAQDFLHKFFRF